jgi:hypothetical protein
MSRRSGILHMAVALRLYGTGVEFFDQTWKPNDVEQMIGPGAGTALQ